MSREDWPKGDLSDGGGLHCIKDGGSWGLCILKRVLISILPNLLWGWFSSFVLLSMRRHSSLLARKLLFLL